MISLRKNLQSVAIFFVMVFSCSLVADTWIVGEFTIEGDFGAIDSDSTEVVVVLSLPSYDEHGVEQSQVIAESSIDDRRVVLTGSIAVPTLAKIEVKFDKNRVDRGNLILEPFASYTFTYLGSNREIVVNGGDERHQRLLGYRTEERFLELDEKFVTQLNRWAELARPSAPTEVGTEPVPNTELADEDSEPMVRKVSIHGSVLDWASMECADWGEIKEVPPKKPEPSPEESEPMVQDELTKAESEMYSAMGARAIYMGEQSKQAYEEAVDSIDALLALELGALDYSKAAVDALNELESGFDEGVFQRRVVLRRNFIANLRRAREIAASLVPGKPSPNFVLPDLLDQEHSLTDILKQHEVVLVDFWASWCGPCIEQFPHLKDLHAQFQDKGFEIVGVSIDQTAEAWIDATDTHQIPWINLGELKDFTGPVTVDFGVNFIPKAYVLDSDGCILKKDLETTELEDFLNARLGVVSE